MLASVLTSATRLMANILLPAVDCDSKFGTKIPWRKNLNDAIAYAKRDVRPLMVVIWMDGCPSCEEFIPKLSSSDEVANLVRKEFSTVALNEHRDEVSKFRTDGGYTPRIYFLNPKGEVDLRFFNKYGDGEPEYRFYYPSVTSVLKAMNDVVEAYPDRCMPSRPCRIHAIKNHPMA